MLRKFALNGLYYTGAQAVLGRLTRGMGSIFMFHHVRNLNQGGFNPNNHLSVSPEFLDRMILYFKRAGHEFISMDDVYERLQNPQRNTKKKPFICITLDDGYRDNLTKAVPVFRRHQVPYLIYIAPGLIEASDPLWWEDIEQVFEKKKNIYVDMPKGRVEFDISTDEKKSIHYEDFIRELLFFTPEEDQRRVAAQLASAHKVNSKEHVKNQIMNWSELNDLSKDPLCTIGAHTIGHYALRKLSAEKSRFEMEQSRAILKSELGLNTTHFAYPYGHKLLAGTREFETAKELGFKTAVTTRHGVIYPEHRQHMTGLPRVSINGNYQSMAYIRSLVSGIPARIYNRGKKIDVEDA